MDEIAEELMPNYKAELEHEQSDYYYTSVEDADSNGYKDLYNYSARKKIKSKMSCNIVSPCAGVYQSI